MISEAQEAVKDFHKAGQITVNCKPMLPVFEDQLLRLRLIREELEELKNAFVADDIVEVADALADLMYVVLGTAVTCGIDLEPIFQEVHKSNMTKFIDGHKREDGKWIKGPSYTPADVKSIVEQQIGLSKDVIMNSGLEESEENDLKRNLP